MIIKEYEKTYKEKIKDLLIELQNYIIEIDKYNLNIITQKYREKYFKNMIRCCKKNYGKIYVALENAEVIGFVSGFIERYNNYDKLDYCCPKKGIIAELVVNKKYRKIGAGKKLVETIENYFKNINCKFVQLDVFAYNEKAIEFYKRQNFEERMITMFKQIK